MLPELADGGSEDSVQKLDLNKSSSLKKQDSREDVSEKLKNERVKDKFRRIHGRDFLPTMLLYRKI